VNERTKAIVEAAALLRANADANVPAIRVQAQKGYYQCAADLDQYRKNLEEAARIVEGMLEKLEQ
jgi:hypothetical protein